MSKYTLYVSRYDGYYEHPIYVTLRYSGNTFDETAILEANCSEIARIVPYYVLPQGMTWMHLSRLYFYLSGRIKLWLSDVATQIMYMQQQTEQRRKTYPLYACNYRILDTTNDCNDDVFMMKE
jgi:hypothetical protein